MERIKSKILNFIKIKYHSKMIKNFANKPEFYIQIEILKAVCIFKVPTRKQKILCKIFQVYSLTTLTVCLYGVLNFVVLNLRNLSEVLDCTPALMGSVFAIINFFSILFHSDKFFRLIDEIRRFNKKCKIL